MANKRKFLSAVLAFVLTFSILPGSLNVYAENQGQHEHGDDCYCKGGEYLCGQDEETPHIHDESCYEFLKGTETGSDAAQKALVCERNEMMSHIHTAECICKGGELICGEADAQISIAPYSGEDGRIQTADDLKTILKEGNISATRGKTFTLENDVEIDTSDLVATFSSNSERVFAGKLDGNGHTITVIDNENAISQPLFDRIEGDTSTHAEVKNLTIIFEGDVSGATLTGSAAYADITDLKVFFKNVRPARYGNKIMASGLIGRMLAGRYSLIKEVDITGEMIGSDEIQSANSAYSVIVSGITSYDNEVSYAMFDGVHVKVDSIEAYGDVNGYVTASGAIGGTRYDQAQDELQNITVSVQNDIKAQTSGRAEVIAAGLTFHCVALYNCKVKVQGNIIARDSGTSDSNIVSASGLAFQADTHRNGNTNTDQSSSIGIQEKSTGATEVQVDGNIEAYDESGGLVYACGAAYSIEYDAKWEGVKIRADHITAVNEGNNANSYSCAVGFSATSSYYGARQDQNDKFDAKNCSVSAEKIEAFSSAGGANAHGFEEFGYYAKTGCKVEVDEIRAHGVDDAAASGFVYYFNRKTNSPESGVWYDDCSVAADMIISECEGTDSGAGGFAYVLEIGAGNKFSVENCQVTIRDEIKAVNNNGNGSGIAGLFATDNMGCTHLYNNTVEIPKSAADIVIIDGKEHVRFTASEPDGRAGIHESWENRNYVIFIGDSDNLVRCVRDDSDPTYQTLWEITKYYSVEYDLDGGIGDPNESYDLEKVLAQGTHMVKAEPTREGYTFEGWSDGTAVYRGGFSLTVTGPLKLTAVWKKITGSLKVTKTISGTGANAADEFYFLVKLSDPSIDGTYGDMEFKRGEAGILLKGGEEKTASGLPAGITYEVTEREADQNGYKTTMTGNTGIIVKDMEATAAFYNTKNASEPPSPDKKYGKIRFVVVNGVFTENGMSEITKIFGVGSRITLSDIPESKGKDKNYNDQTWDKYPLGYVVGEDDTTFTITYQWVSSESSGGGSDSDTDISSTPVRNRAEDTDGRYGRWILEGGEFTENNGRLPSNEYLKIGDTIYGFYTYGFAIDFDRPEYYTDAAIRAKGGYRDAEGTWRLNGWWFLYDDGTFPHGEWKHLIWAGRSDWYYFDVDGWMEDGWLYWHNNWYYLHTKYDNTRGHMYTGWHEIDGKWYYFNTPADTGTLGAMLKNTTTPDGYQVGADGAWIPYSH